MTILTVEFKHWHLMFQNVSELQKVQSMHYETPHVALTKLDIFIVSTSKLVKSPRLIGPELDI